MRLSRTLPLLLSFSAAIAAPLSELEKRQYCAAGSQVCYTFCCLPGTQCVLDSTTESGFNCQAIGDPNYTPYDGAFTYTLTQNLLTVSVTPLAAGATPTPTYAVTPGEGTPGLYTGTPGITPGNTPGISGTYVAPALPTTGTNGVKVSMTGTGTGAFITAVPTNTGIVPVPIGETSVGAGSLTGAQIGGIVGGVIGGVGLLALLCFWCCVYGLCAAFGGRRRHGSEDVVEERRNWRHFIPVALGGAVLAENRHRHGRHSTTTVVTEKRNESHWGRNAAIVGSLGAFWLYERFKKDREERQGYRPPKHQEVVTEYSSSSTSSYTESGSGSRTHSDTNSSSVSHSSSSSGFRSVDSRTPPPARVPPPRRYR